MSSPEHSPVPTPPHEFAATRKAGLITISAALLLASVVAVVSSCQSTPSTTRPSTPSKDPKAPIAITPPPQSPSTAAKSWKPADASKLILPALPREFRGVWVATVANIDWPSRPALPTSTQRGEMIAMLDKLAALHFNAVILQVRPCCDALYPSSIEPWSEFLTGKSGQAPNPIWDPLAEWITQAHARGLELHAWVNPFRARHFEEKGPAAQTHISRTRADLVHSYDQYLWLDPGEKDAQDYSLRVIRDIVSRYDIDGLHIDDYFYPYPKGNDQFPDDRAWQQYRKSSGSLARDDWRRSNIDTFVERMSREAHAAKPTLRVGISPFGIWRPDHPPGIKGLDAHARLYSDSRKWLSNGWLDYCSPQLYWRLDSKEQPYEPLLKWWLAQNPRGRAIWPGNYASKMLPSKDAKSPPWPADEIIRQIAATRATSAGGNIQFSAKTIIQNAGGLADALSKGPYAAWSIPPAMPWLSARAPAPTVHVDPALSTPSITVRWSTSPGSTVRQWVLAVRSGGAWTLRPALPTDSFATIAGQATDAIALWSIGPAGVESQPAVMELR